ncbi:MAG: hypothetical protein ACM3WP_25285 [Acidobacteriota bacterium]
MQHLIARFLLLFAVGGTFVPPVLQASGAPSHLCCRRSAQHRCHTYALINPEQAAIHAPGCSRECRRAAAISQWAHPEPWRAVSAQQGSAAKPAEAGSHSLAVGVCSARSTRAPPV